MTTETPCTHPDTWFDRSMCAEPCGSMHDRCTQCGVVVGEPCRNESDRLSAQQELKAVEARVIEGVRRSSRVRTSDVYEVARHIMHVLYPPEHPLRIQATQELKLKEWSHRGRRLRR